MSFYFMHTPGIAWDEFDGEAVLVDVVKGRVWTLNPSASFIWRQCREGAQPEYIAKALTGANTETRQTSTEVAAFLAELESHGLLHKDASIKPLTRSHGTQVTKPSKRPYVAPKILREETLARPHPPVNPNSVTKLPP
jgi:hypothetical protein